jgi:hypothetical protein
MRRGAKATAIVLESRPWGWAAGVVRPNQKLTLKVHYGDGSTTTVTRIERTHYLLQDESVGSTIPMRYDPADRSYLDIDRQALIEQHIRTDEKINEARIQEAEDRLHRHDD